METEMRKEQFVRLYTTEANSVFRFCYSRTSDKEVAVDITQDTFLRFWVTLAREKKTIRNERALLFAIARNSVIDWYRKKKPLSLDALVEESGTDGELFSDMAQKEEIETAHEAKILMEKIRQLEPIYRQAVHSRFVHDWGPKEIAKKVGVSPNVVSVRLYRGIRQLRKLAGYENTRY